LKNNWRNRKGNAVHDEFFEHDLVARFYVYRTIASKPALVGTLGFSEASSERFVAHFRYAQAYIDHPTAYPLDPLNLPLSDAQRVFSSSSRYHVLGALFDAVPDAWGRKVLAASHPGDSLTEPAVLGLGSGMGAGELYFSTELELADSRQVAVPSIQQISVLSQALVAVESNDPLTAQQVRLLASSRDIGGARPKAVVCDDAGTLWIAKFPRAGESFDRQRIEWANLEMAKDIGLTVPEHELVECERGAVLLTKRFDRIEGRKQHFLSAASLISPSPTIDKREIDAPVGQAVFSYARIADVVQRISASPVRDLQELFARMVFNVVTHNVDDHLKNTGFVRQNGTKELYRLSPLYDVVTQEGSLKHMLRIGHYGRVSSLENALSDARRMRIRPDTAQMIVDRVVSVFTGRRVYYERAGMSKGEIEAVERYLSWQNAAPHK
jgi:serine/threonine-protein kinase HipA